MKVSVLLSGGTGVGLNFLPPIPCITGSTLFFLPSSPGGVFLGNLGGDPNAISDQKISLSTPIFRPGLQEPDPFSDLKLLRFV